MHTTFYIGIPYNFGNGAIVLVRGTPSPFFPPAGFKGCLCLALKQLVLSQSSITLKTYWC